MVAELFPHYPELFAQRGWKMLPTLDRVYVNDLARRDLDWQPRFDFGSVLERLGAGQPVFSPITTAIGMKGYHPETFAEGPYPVAP